MTGDRVDASGLMLEHLRALDEVSAEHILAPRERAIRDAVREVVAHRVAPVAAQLDRDRRFAGPSFQALAAEGLVGILMPEELGGTDDSLVAYACAVEEIAAACPSTSMIYVTQSHAAHPICEAASPDLAAATVPGLMTGETYGSLVITEPDAGSDARSMSTTARRVSGGWRLNGSKTFITTGDRSDVLLVFATTDRASGRDAIAAFVVDGSSDGLQRGRPLEKLGLHASSTAELFFDEVYVPDECALAVDGDGWGLLMRTLLTSRVSAAAQGIGMAKGAYLYASLRLVERYRGALPEDVAFDLAELRGAILEGRLLLLSVLKVADETGEMSIADMAIMKQRCTDLGFHVAVDAAGLLGAEGDLKALQVERFVRDAKAAQIYDGTNEIQRLLVSRDWERRTRKARR